MLIREYKDFSEAYFDLNREILLHPELIDYQENTRGILENLFITLNSIDCEGVDLAPLGYAKQKWSSLVRTYLDMDQLRRFYHMCTISKGSSIAFDFKRKSQGNGSCMREIILTRCNHKKPWDTAKIIWRATELQKRWAADLILIHHILKKIPNCQIKKVEFYMASAYQSGVYVVPLIGPLFGVDIAKLDPEKSRYWKTIQYQNAKRFQPDSPRHKLSPGWRMQDLAKAFREGKKFEPLTYREFELEV